MSDKAPNISKSPAQMCFPELCEEVENIYEDISFPEENPWDPALPYVVINMVSSVDGKTSSNGKSGSIGGDVDRKTMRTLRSKVDAVAIGAGTIRAEKVSLTSEGLRNPEPKAIIITSSLDFPPENMVSSGEQKTIILTAENKTSARRDTGPATSAEILSVKSNPGGKIELVSALKVLKREHGINKLLLEGGPSINAGMVSIGLVSEIFITVAPKLLGGEPDESAGILSGRLMESTSRALSLSQIHVSSPDGEVFIRYRFAENYAQNLRSGT